ncbi:B-cell antigen receptor complex-associated protein alpha chain [Numida meleagris]|uniref:B-cell antigen receptor complex-associated protein alpha chain n=1 Tax=Numida meleagris TaxID=8996 RepID=UPI000B3DE8C7|nr:B-cell antigen receptor complex-associated protein alpha chain [Numida meleagris]
MSPGVPQCPLVSPLSPQKRWANERLLQSKKSLAEEENLYEGLNLEECSMYEDISRGPHVTYQDVGTRDVTSPGLEKP